MQTVEHIMTRRVICVREEDTMETIRAGMETYGLRHIPVVDGDKLVGLLSHRDLLSFADSQYHSTRATQAVDQQRLEQTFVANVMTREVQTVRPATLLADAAEILLKHRFGCLPVTTPDGELLGIVTEHDFLKVMIDLLRETG